MLMPSYGRVASSVDSDYDGMTINNVVANISDNDIAGVTVSQSDGTTEVTEGGTTDAGNIAVQFRWEISPKETAVVQLLLNIIPWG